MHLPFRLRRRFFLFALAVISLMPPPFARADHTVWYNPTNATLAGSGTIVLASSPEAVRVQYPGGDSQVTGSLTIPLNPIGDGMIDSIYVCYQTSLHSFGVGPGSSLLSGVELRAMALPISTTTIFTDSAPHSALPPGECLGYDVADMTPFGALDIKIDFALVPVTFIEIGAIGIKLTTPVVGVNETPGSSTPSLAIAPGWPNPFSPRTRIEYLVAEPGRVRLQIVDTAGRVVRSLLDRDLTPGPYTAWWDGRDDGGRPLPSGVYFSRVANDRESRAGRLVLLR